MADLDRELRDAASHVAPRWDDARARRVREAMHARKTRRAQVRRIGSAAALAVAVLLTLAGSGRLAAAASAVVRFFSALTTSEPVTPPGAPAVVASTPPTPAHERPVATAVDDPALPAPEPAVPPTSSTTAPRESTTHERQHATPQTDWRALARDQDFAAAYDAFHKAPKDVRDEAEDLLLASDVARLSKHPDEAVEPLRKILREHRSDSRAPLAAFTLGRVLLSDLHRADEAADAFADARALAPSGTLAEDALAREVEAASAAGDATRAHARAEEYVTKYPNGTRTATVRRFGALP